jgi:hypothetical protein
VSKKGYTFITACKRSAACGRGYHLMAINATESCKKISAENIIEYWKRLFKNEY